MSRGVRTRGSEVTSGGGPRSVRGGRLRVRGEVGGLSVGYFGRVQDVFAVRAELNVGWRAWVVGSLGKA